MLGDLSRNALYVWNTDAMKLYIPASDSAIAVDGRALRLLCEMNTGEECIVSLSEDEVPSETSGKCVNLRAFNLQYYEYKEIWLNIDQLGDVPGLYRHVDPAHVRSLKTRIIHFG